MLIVRQLVEPTAVNAVCVLRLENGTSVLLVSISECVHVYQLHSDDSSTPAGSPSSSSTATGTSTSSAAPQPSPAGALQPRGHIFNVGCGVASIVALANQCFLIWTRDQECVLVRYQANLDSILTDPCAVDGESVYHADGSPSPVHYKEHHWFVVHRVRLWCPDNCAPLHPPEVAVNDSVETVHLRFCTGHAFLLSIRWHPDCLPTNSEAAEHKADGAATLTGLSLRTSRWHSSDYMRVFAGTGFHYPAQSCSVATRRPGESAAAHQQRIEQLWQSGSTFANVPDEDLIATHAVRELSRHKHAPWSGAAAHGAESQNEQGASAAAADGGGGAADYGDADWTGVRGVSVRRETYSASSPTVPTPAFYCNAQSGGFANVRTVSGVLAVHHAPMDLFISRSTPLRDDYAAERQGAFAVISPRRNDRRMLEWTAMVFLTSSSHTAVYHLQRPRTMLGTPRYVLDGIFGGSRRVRQVLFCLHSRDASSDVWVVLDGGAVTRFSVAELRARGPAALNVKTAADQFPWPTTTIAGLPPSFRCRQLLPADELVTPRMTVEAWSRAVGSGHRVHPAEAQRDTRHRMLGVYPCARRYALFADCVQDVYLVDLVERCVVAALAGDGPMTDVCEAPHGYVAAFARGMLRLYQPGMQLHSRGSARLPPFGVSISKIYAARLGGAMGGGRHGVPTAAAAAARRVEAHAEPGAYVVTCTHHTSQLYRVVGPNMLACPVELWPYTRDETTLAFDAFHACDGAAADGCGYPMLVQCSPTRCLFGAIELRFPVPLARAAVASVREVGPICVGSCGSQGERGTVLVVATVSGVCEVDVAVSPGDPLDHPASLWVRGLERKGRVEVLVGRWDGGITVLEIQLDSSAAATASSMSPSPAWRCVASQTIQGSFHSASAVHRFIPLPPAGVMARWMTMPSNGEVAILALGRRQRAATTDGRVDGNEEEEEEAEKGTSMAEAATELFYTWTPTSPPTRRAQQKVTSAVAPVVRATVPSSAEDAGVFNGFDGAMLQPRDGAMLFFSVPLEEGDSQAPPHMQRLRESDEEDPQWMTRLETTVRAIVPPDATGQVRAAPWRCAVLLESRTDDGCLRYDALVVQHDQVTLYTLDSHLFAPAYARAKASTALTDRTISSAAGLASRAEPPRRAFTLACTAPSRYICTNRVQLPQLSPHETLISIAREPDDEGDGVLLCVSVCPQTAQTRLTTLHCGTLAVLDSLVLPGRSVAHWMSAVPPSTPSIARTAPLFVLCCEDLAENVVRLQVVAAQPLRIASSAVLEDPVGWLDVASRGAKIDGAVQVVPTRLNSEGATYGGEVLVTVVVDHAIHLFVLRSYTLLFQHCVLSPSCATSVTLCYPIVSVCTEGDTDVYLQVYPVDDDTEMLAPAYSTETTRPLKKYGKVSWKMRLAMREATFGAPVLAQTALYDRCVRADVEGDVTVSFINLSSTQTRTSTAPHIKGDDAYVGSAEGPQTFLTHAVRLPTVPVQLRLLRHVSPVQRRYARQLQCSGHSYHLQSSSLRKDRSSRMLLIPCHDGSLYSAFEIPYGFAHPLLRLEQVITDAYALDLSLHVNPSHPAVLQHTFHMTPFHMARALHPLIGMRQAEKQAVVMADAVLEYFLLRDMMRHGYAGSRRRRSSGGGSGDGGSSESGETAVGEGDAAVVRRKFGALNDLVLTLLTEEYGEDFSVDACAEMLSIL